MNAWPLDEGLIDYVDPAYGTAIRGERLYAALNVVATPKFTLSGDRGGRDRDHAGADLRDAARGGRGSRPTWPSGYHAIEFLLWGQDLNGTGPGAGNRPHTDYAAGRGLHRRQLRPAARLSAGPPPTCWSRISNTWPRNGPRAAPRAKRSRADPRNGLQAMLTGMGSLVLRRAGGRADEAGPDAERPRGRARLLLGQHPQQPLLRRAGHPERLSRPHIARVDGSTVEGPSLSDLGGRGRRGAGRAASEGRAGRPRASEARRDAHRRRRGHGLRPDARAPATRKARR
ncbi:MAG: hypothetical protein MZV49_19605 [Rhodopseudomonas palustris]|nr:hypothetical protein [Rhodopseudomonas palustris]